MAMATSSNVASSAAMAHGVKRAASDNLEGEQRMTKRFDLLSLDHHGKQYIPIDTRRNSETATSFPPPKPRIDPMPDDDVMQLENTPHKVYIYDLDKELADIESDEENPIFLSDIEKHLSKIPRHILQDQRELKPTSKNQLVLYNVPSSISVPAEQDNVKKAIMEARARMKHRQILNPNGMSSDGSHHSESSKTQSFHPSNEKSYDDDTEDMDIEEEL